MPKITPKYIASLYRSVGLNRKQITAKAHPGDPALDDGTTINDRVKMLMMDDEHPVCLVPSLTRSGLKLEWLLICRNPEIAAIMDEAFWRELAEILDDTDPLVVYDWTSKLQGDETSEQYMDLTPYYEFTRKSLLEARSLAFDAQKQFGDIPRDQTFSEFMADDPWIGRVTDDEYDPTATERSLARHGVRYSE